MTLALDPRQSPKSLEEGSERSIRTREKYDLGNRMQPRLKGEQHGVLRQGSALELLLKGLGPHWRLEREHRCFDAGKANGKEASRVLLQMGPDAVTPLRVSTTLFECDNRSIPEASIPQKLFHLFN